MKLLLFLIIILIIYLLAINIKVVHTSTMPIVEKKEVEDRHKIRKMLTNNHIKTFDNYDDQQTFNYQQIEKFTPIIAPDHKNDKLPTAKKLLSMIKSEFLIDSYLFNIANLPVTTRHPSSDSVMKDKKYKKYIEKSIEEWNEILDDNYLSIKYISLFFIKETASEFVIMSNNKLLYQNKSLHLQTTFYGTFNKNDDFINGGSDTWTLQLVDIKPITKTDFDSSLNLSKKWIGADSQNYGPFMSMAEQMTYVNKINKMHQDESHE